MVNAIDVGRKKKTCFTDGGEELDKVGGGGEGEGELKYLKTPTN